MSQQPKSQQIRSKYIQNCNLIGELSVQARNMQKRIEALVDENVRLSAEFSAMQAAMQEAEAEKTKVAQMSQPKEEGQDGKDSSSHQS